MSDQNTQAEPQGGAPSLTPQEQAAIEKAQQGLTEPTNVLTPPPSGPQRPDWLPEQFWKDGKADFESLAKSYGELRSKMDSAPKVEEKPAEQPAAAPVQGDGKIKAEPKEQQQAAPAADLGKAMEAARAEWAEKQEVSEATVSALEAAGIPKEILSVYLEGVKLVQQQTLDTIYGFAGGKENYEAMSRWAAASLSEKELEAFNSALDSPELRENAVRGLYARFSEARPQEGKLITPTGSPSAAGDIYTDKSQLLADQRDPRYQTDPTFRQTVVDKLARSQRAGFQLVQRPMFERSILSNQ